MALRRSLLLSALSLAVTGASPALSAPGGTATPTETLYTGGTILTMAGPTPRTVEALGVAGGRITYAGPLKGAPRQSSTRVVSLQGRTLLPGFIDTHGHFIYFGKNLIDADLFGAGTVEEIVQRMKDQASKVGGSDWIVGFGFSGNALNRYPSVAELDAVSSDLDTEELAARCHALLRRPRQLHTRWDPMQASIIDFGVLTVDVGRKEIRVHGADVPVTRIEFALFEQLCRRPAEVCTRAELLEEVWGPNWVGDTHVVDVHLSNLRRKLQQRAPEQRFIHTVRGVGFRLSNDLLRAGDGDRMLASA